MKKYRITVTSQQNPYQYIIWVTDEPDVIYSFYVQFITGFWANIKIEVVAE